MIRAALEQLDNGAIGAALQILDRAWRTLPDAETSLSAAYASLLALDGGDPDAALSLLRRAAGIAPSADLAALTVLTLLRRQRAGQACAELLQALERFCIHRGSLLETAADLLVRQPGARLAGWFGRGPRLELTGQLAPQALAGALEVQLGSGARFTRLLPHPEPRQTGRFSFELPAPAERQVTVSAGGHELAGTGAFPLDYGLAGGIEATAGHLHGWLTLGWDPQRTLAVLLRDDSGHRLTLRACARGGRCVFSLRLRGSGLRGNRIHVSARMPDGQWRPLPGSPLLSGAAVRLPGPVRRLGTWVAPRLRASPARAGRQRPVDVIVPVYGNPRETLDCLCSVLATLPSWAHLVIVDDASPDATLAQALDERARDPRVTLLRNPDNLGFVGSVNRGLALNPAHDVVLLNSDTVVSGDWLRRLCAAASSSGRIGTVTPLSNNGSIASYPRATGAGLTPAEAADLDALAARIQGGRRLPIPVGVGFCLFVRRECLQQVGVLDQAVFGAGYGEETDFCLRARRYGWIHLLAADTFVYHAGGSSFGARRAALLARSQRLINLRHPGYDRFIDSFEAADPLQDTRRALDEARLLQFAGRFVVIVTLALPGGVDRYVAERASQLRAQDRYVLVLRPAAHDDDRHCRLWTNAVDAPNLRYRIARELPHLAALLLQLAPAGVELQHFLGLHPRLIETVRRLPCGYDVMIHDYAWICPRITLIGGNGRYCGEPAVKHCAGCIRRHGAVIKDLSVPALRRRSARWLREAGRIQAPSHDTAQRIRHHFGLPVAVQPHAPLAVAPGAAWQPAMPDGRLRVALIGAIGPHKGYELLLACARDARRRRLPLEFVVIGFTTDDETLLRTGRVAVTGRYTDPEAQHLLRRERPAAIWLPSVWPETWCYALDHALATGLPVVSFDIGAIGERLRSVPHASLLPLATSPGAINDHLLQTSASLQSDTEMKTSKRKPAPKAKTRARTSARRAAVARKPVAVKKAPRKVVAAAPAAAVPTTVNPRADGLGASVQTLPLPAGLYLFSVTAAGSAKSRSSGLHLPAIHVITAPGTHPGHVEFVDGPGSHGAWLSSPGDLLVVRIAAPAVLVLTSVQAPGGETLSIKVEKLEARRAGATSTTAPATLAAGPAVPPSDDAVPVQIDAHIRTRGDMTFTDPTWAGRVGPGLWIESFSILPLARFGAPDIEYKGLTGSGFETPWITEQKMCGTRGMGVPLVGFALRLKPGPETAAFDCEYSGSFQSGATVGPLRNGAPCRSNVANDPLEGIQVRIIRRGSAAPAASAARTGKP